MRCYITKDGTRHSLTLRADPAWSRAEQGGYRDATIPVEIPTQLQGSLAGCAVELKEVGTHYFGTVKSASNDTLYCAGEQEKLANTRKGEIVRMESSTAQFVAFSEAAQLIDMSGVSTWQLSVPDVAEDVVLNLDFPEAITGGRLNIPYLNLYPGGDNIVSLYYNTAYGRGPGTFIAFITSETLTHDIPAGATSIQVVAQVLSMVDIRMGVLYGTSVTSTTLPNVIAYIAAQAGITHYECTASATINDLKFDQKATPQSKIAELLKYGDFQAFFTSRIVAGQEVPYFVFRAAPTTVKYRLTEDGSTVKANLVTDTTDGLISVVRAHYTDAYGRARHQDASDADPTHKLVHAAQTVYYDIDVDTTSATTALAAAQAAVARLGAPRANGQVVIEGAPNGLPACLYEPGELYEFALLNGKTITSRVTEADYEGAYRATLTVDDAQTEDAILTRIASGK